MHTCTGLPRFAAFMLYLWWKLVVFFVGWAHLDMYHQLGKSYLVQLVDHSHPKGQHQGWTARHRGNKTSDLPSERTGLPFFTLVNDNISGLTQKHLRMSYPNLFFVNQGILLEQALKLCAMNFNQAVNVSETCKTAGFISISVTTINLLVKNM